MCGGGRSAGLGCSWANDVGFDAVSALRREYASRGRVSARALIVGAGEGDSGTASLNVALQSLGVRTHHYDLRLTKLLSTFEPESYASLDWPELLRGYDAVVDQPHTQFFPLIFAAFPNARVLHTVREPLEWVSRRSHRHGGIAPKPVSSLLARMQLNPHAARRPEARPTANATAAQRFGLLWPTRGRAAHSYAIAYAMQNAYYRCIVPVPQYMLLRPLDGDYCRPSFMPRLAAFVNRTASLDPRYCVKLCPCSPGSATRCSGAPARQSGRDTCVS